MKVNEIFYAIQGEGPRMGKPTTFIRMAGCNLIEEGMECKFCDTLYAERGKEVDNNWVAVIATSFPGDHATFTGGEPTLQDEEIKRFLEKNLWGYKTAVETNGTIYTQVSYDNIIISPKKQNINLDVLTKYSGHDNVDFKFVYELGKERWWENLPSCIIGRKERVWIMPEGKTRQQQIKRMPEVMEYCINRGYNFSPRLQVLAFDTRRGV